MDVLLSSDRRFPRKTRFPDLVGLIFCVVLFGLEPAPASAQCDEEPPLQNYTGAGSVVCPCFVPGEQAGAVLDAPAGDYPIEILRVGIGWGSQFGGAPQSLEQAINIYGAGLPNPGVPIFSLPGPLMTDGFINEFDLEPLPGEITVNSGPFTVALEFFNNNAGDIFAPSMVHDGNGCQIGKNVVRAIPGGWNDACLLGVTGDWIVYAIYRPACAVSAGEEFVAASVPSALMAPQPNPFRETTRIEFLLDRREHVDLSVYDLQGRLVTSLLDGEVLSGRHRVAWNGTWADGSRAASGVYFVMMTTGSFRSTQKVVRLD